MVDGLITIEGRVYLPPASACLVVALQNAHGSGYEGIECTMHRLCIDFYLSGALSIVQDHVWGMRHMPAEQKQAPSSRRPSSTSQRVVHCLG
jgi:hypothetical protein